LWNSSLGKIYLGEYVVVISSDKVEGSVDWNSMKFQDTANKAYDVEINLRVEENMISNEYVVKLCLEHKVKRGNKIVKKELIVALRAGGHLTQEEVAKEAIAIRMSQKFALLEEERPIIETMAYHDKYKNILNEVWKDKVELDGKIVKEEEEAVKRIKGEALKEKEDPQLGVPRVGIPRPPRASMQDLYDRMGRMEIRQEVIEWMKYGSYITRIVLSAVPTSATTVSTIVSAAAAG
ncbi:hypothetical protein Tco_0900857, partial [Tanacetum coccineum]